MKTIYTLVSVLTVAFLFSCGGMSRADKLSGLIAEQEGEKGTKDSLAVLYEKFATEFPEHSKSASYLYLAADHYKINDVEKSADLFGRYFKQYPDSTQAANSLFNAAFLLENSNSSLSIEYYKKFIHTYPDDERTEQAKQNLRYVGKPAEYIMEQLRQSGLLQEEMDSLEAEIQ